jgi:hypothetical protein
MYMVVSCHDNVGQSYNLRTANKSSKNVAKFEYVGTTVTNQNCVNEDIKSRLNFGVASYHSLQIFLSSCLLSKNSKTKICRTIILPSILYECESWSLTLRVEHRLRVFEYSVLRRITHIWT